MTTMNATEYDRVAIAQQNQQQNEIAASPLDKMPPSAASNKQPNPLFTRSRLGIWSSVAGATRKQAR